MEICSDNHDEVCYETAKCPACLSYESGKSEGYDSGYNDGYNEGVRIMSKMTLNVDFVCGTKILDACAEAVILATKLGINVRFDFNDIEVIAHPNVCPTALAEEYRRVLLSEDEIKMAIVI